MQGNRAVQAILAGGREDAPLSKLRRRPTQGLQASTFTALRRRHGTVRICPIARLIHSSPLTGCKTLKKRAPHPLTHLQCQHITPPARVVCSARLYSQDCQDEPPDRQIGIKTRSSSRGSMRGAHLDGGQSYQHDGRVLAYLAFWVPSPVLL